MILLLLIALVPLVFVTLLANRATYRLNREIGSQTRRALTERAEQQLQLFVNGKAALLGREGRIIELGLQLQAREVERCLAAAAPPAPRVYYSEDYDRGIDLPDDMTTSQRYRRVAADGEPAPIPVTRSEQVFKLAPNVTREAVADDVKRLAMMTPVYRALYEEQGNLFYWQYTGLEDGIHSCYPGHGGYPAVYDLRQRDWYKRAKEQGGLCWTPPYVEVSTRQAVLTAAMPVHRPDGSFAGVTAIDVTVAEIVQRGTLPKLGSSVARMVVLVPRAEFDPNHPRQYDVLSVEPEELGLFVLAQPAEGKADARWQAPYKTVWLESDDQDQFLKMIRDMTAGQSGVRRMSYQHRPSLWAYGQAWQDRGYLVVIAPYDEVIAKAVQAQETVLSLTRSQLKLTAAILVAVCLIVSTLAFLGSRAVTKPVRRLVEAARRIAHGDFEARVRIDTRDELGELGRTFDDMVPKLQDRMRMRQSLALAMEVQRNLLPAGPPSVEGLDIAGESIYCDETGGDYYDFLDLSELGPRELGIAVGDVTGHGIAAALLMTSARALLRSGAGQPGTLSELMEQINRHLTVDTPVGRFMTLFYMVIDTQHKSIRWANAGHDPAIIYDPGTDSFGELGGGGIPLGIEMNWAYKEFRRDRLDPGQIIVIGTDGIWETHNPQREMFGKEALREIIRQHANSSAEEISRAITGAIADFRQHHPQEDDVTLVVAKALS